MLRALALGCRSHRNPLLITPQVPQGEYFLLRRFSLPVNALVVFQIGRFLAMNTHLHSLRIAALSVLAAFPVFPARAGAGYAAIATLQQQGPQRAGGDLGAV